MLLFLVRHDSSIGEDIPISSKPATAGKVPLKDDVKIAEDANLANYRIKETELNHNTVGTAYRVTVYRVKPKGKTGGYIYIYIS